MANAVGRPPTLWAVVLLAIGAWATTVRAQDPWEYSPYRIRLWVVAPDGELAEPTLRMIERGLRDRADNVVGAPWDLIIDQPPAMLRADLAMRLDTITSDELLAVLKTAPPPTPNKSTAATESSTPADAAASPPNPAAANATGESATDSSDKPATPTATDELQPVRQHLKEVLRGDKLLVVSLRQQASGLTASVREFDCKARRWSACLTQTAAVGEQLTDLVFDAWLKVFTPIARLDNVKDKHAHFRLRAAMLATREDSPILVGSGAILRPFTRHNDRFGEPRNNGILPVMWTYLIVEERDGSRVKTEIHSGMQSPLGGRSNPRTERFALLVRPAFDKTTLRLRTNEKPARPLSGYDVYSKDPQSDAVEELGRTDWRGTIDVPVKGFPLRVIYLRNGGQLLVRLPIVPGVEPQLFVDLVSDDKRLQAEGFVSGVQATITDLMAQRELLAARIRRRIEEKKFDDAQKLLDEFKLLETRDDISRLLDQQQTRITSPHKSVQSKITKLFDEARKNLQKFIDPDLGNRLSNELLAAKEGRPLAPVGPKTTDNQNTGPQNTNDNQNVDDGSSGQSLFDRLHFNSAGLWLLVLAIAVIVLGVADLNPLLNRSGAPDYMFFLTNRFVRLAIALVGLALAIFALLVTAGLA